MSNSNKRKIKNSKNIKAHAETSDKELPTPEEILEKLPPKEQEQVISIFRRMNISAGFMGSITHPLIEKLTADHITDLIKNDEKENIRFSEDRKNKRKFDIWVILILTSFLIFICVFFTLTKNQDMLFKIIEFIVLIAGGAGIGIGFKKRE